MQTYANESFYSYLQVYTVVGVPSGWGGSVVDRIARASLKSN